MLERVREPLLDDPVRREVECARERLPLALDAEVHGQPRPVDLVEQRAQVVEPRLRAELHAVAVAAHRAKEVAHLRERGAAGPLDALERFAVVRVLLGKVVPDGADLQHHHAEGVSHDVVELAGDVRALLGHRNAGGGVALPFCLGGPLLGRHGLRGAFLQRESREPADPEHERDEDLLGG